MATEDDDPVRDQSSDSASDSGSDNDDGDSGEEQKVEWLATTRARRSTAGNRMKSMLANEEPAADDDDLELLFAEDGEDAGFTDAEKDDSDVHMDSSSDDEDADENGDEDAGEKELERQAREKRNAQRKRKAQAAIPVKFRKKVRIEQPPTASASPAPQAAPKPRPKKKSERASWLPTPAEMPTRASQRQTTKLSKEQLHQQMIEREIKRKKLVEAMERKAKKMEALKKPPLTQAQRLAEAAAVEKRNAKSLNRWEEAEKQREEERLRKIAALQNRKLDGPVVTFWSGIQELDGDQMKNLGKMVAIEEKAPRKKRQSLAATQVSGDQADNDSKPATPVEGPNAAHKGRLEAAGQAQGQPGVNASVPALQPSTVTPPAQSPSAPTPPPPSAQQPPAAPPPPDAPRFAPLPLAVPAAQQTPVSQPSPAFSPMQPLAPQSQLQAPRGPMAPPPIPPPPAGGSGFLAAPSMLGFGTPPTMGTQMPMMGMQAPNTQPSGLAPPGAHPSGLSAPSPLSMPQPQPQAPPQILNTAQPMPTIQQTMPTTQQGSPSVTASTTAASLNSPSLASPPPPQIQLQTEPVGLNPLQPIQGKASPISPNTPDNRTPAPSETGKVTRSCIILQNFDETAIKDKQVQTRILFGRKMNKLAKPTPPALCAITNKPARYRDPITGLRYHDAYAYKEIRRLHRGDYNWSRLLGAWVGSGTFAAKGVPGRFLDPSLPSEDAQEAKLVPLDVQEDDGKEGKDGEKKPDVVGAGVPVPESAPPVAAPAPAPSPSPLAPAAVVG
ncbi:YL1 nuclear protein-domain-containing protein [Coniochaeta sp. 2T2.1]|nr:YL1 nuclear protein-domain-containing protein [Coniochaeta sp. 2T2.1]